MTPGAVQLSLYIGPAPVPAPREIVEALTEVRIECGSGDAQSGFELSFDLPTRSPLRTLFLISGGGAAPPLMRVALVVTINGAAESIIDGVATNVETQPGGGGVGRLIVKGKDMSALMDIIEFPGIPYPAMPPSVRVLAILAKYVALGVVPMVIPSVIDVPPIPLQQIPSQRGSDYAYVKRLAKEAGYVFYLEAGPTPGASKAYWGPEIRFGAPQPALTTNMDALNNVEEISFTFDKERKAIPIVFVQESVSKAPIPIPIPDVTPMSPPLGVVPPLPPKIEALGDTAHKSIPQALMAGLAYSSEHSDCVFGSGKLDVARYGRLLKSRRLVGVRGVGLPYDGLYYVKSVTHEIERGSYKQSFSLARNGLISTLPTVPA